mgnify:CR=1 FL=1
MKMKIKYLCMLSALLLLNVSCAKQNNDSVNAPTGSSTAPTEADTPPETTTPTTTTTTTKTTTVTTTAITATTETTAVTTTFPIKKTTPAVTTATPKTTAPPETTAPPPETEAPTEAISLVGLWEYNDYAGNRMEFRNDGSMIAWQDYSSVISFSDGNLIMSNSTTPIEVSGTIATATEGDNLVLSMTAEAGANMDSLQGKFSLNDCMIAETLGNVGRMLWIDGDHVYFGVASSYSVNGNRLTLGSGSQAYDNAIELDGSTLTITTGDGSEDVLIKLQ